MSYSVSDIKKLIEEKAGGDLLTPAKLQEQIIRMHSKECSRNSWESQARDNFYSYLKKTMTKDKFGRLINTITFPLQTVGFTSPLIDEHQAIFRSRDRFIDFTFRNESLRDDFINYLDGIKFNKMFQEQAFEKYRYMINCLMVVDMPEEAKSPPEPYLCFKSINDIKAIVATPESVDFVAFEEEKRIVVYDSEKYAQIPIVDGKIEYSQLTEQPHDLKECPANWFWSSSIEGYTKKHPLSKHLGDLDRLLKRYLSKDVLDDYTPFPVASVPDVRCDYSDGHRQCKDGYLWTLEDQENGSYAILDGNNDIVECPNCGVSQMTGPGVVVAVRANNDGKYDLSNSVKFTSPEVKGAEYYADSIEGIEDKISYRVTGKVDVKNDVAKNEKQISSSFETQTNILTWVKSNFEKAYQWAVSIKARLRYGDSFISASVNFGKEFMLYSVDELFEIYNKAKESGASAVELDLIDDTMIETMHANNETKRARAKFLKSIEPFRHQSVKDVLEAYKANPELFDYREIILKQNFSQLVSQFETEWFNVLDFREGVSDKQKKEVILKELFKYIEGAKEFRNTTARSSEAA